MITYLSENFSDLLLLTGQQLELVLTSLVLAFILAIILIILCLKSERSMNILVYVFSILYAIPSYAFFALLIPFLGLGSLTAIFVLTLYCEYILLRTFSTGLDDLDSSVIEVANAIGMTSWQVFFKVQLPLILPSIFSGLRVALVACMGSATIAATISAGGLGQVLFTGLQMQDLSILLVGTFLTMILTLVMLGIISIFEKILLQKED